MQELQRVLAFLIVQCAVEHYICGVCMKEGLVMDINIMDNLLAMFLIAKVGISSV